MAMKVKQIVLEIVNHDVTFEPTPDTYGDYVGQMAQGNIADGAHNFVMRSVTEDGKPYLRELDDQNPGAMMQIAGLLMAEYAPQIAISVKKSTASLQA